MTLDEIKDEIQRKNFLKALQLMEGVKQEHRTAEYYLLKGICIQVANLDKLQGEEAETALRKAIELNPKYKDAKLELAYFLLNVKKDPSSAKKYFLEVLQATRDEVPAALSNLIESTEELKNTNSTFVNNLKHQADTYLSNAEKKGIG